MLNNPLNPQNTDAEELDKIKERLEDAYRDKTIKIDEFSSELDRLGIKAQYLDMTADEVSADLAPKMDAMHPKLEVVLNSIGVWVNAKRNLREAEKELGLPNSQVTQE